MSDLDEAIGAIYQVYDAEKSAGKITVEEALSIDKIVHKIVAKDFNEANARSQLSGHDTVTLEVFLQHTKSHLRADLLEEGRNQNIFIMMLEDATGKLGAAVKADGGIPSEEIKLDMVMSS